MTTQQLRLPQVNDVCLVGRLTRDPELRFTTKGAAVCRFDLAVNRRYKDNASGEWKEDVSFIPVVVWREAGQRCGERLKKGSPVYVEGRLKSRSWETKEGQKRTGLEVESMRVQFLERTEAADASEGEGPVSVPDAPEPAERAPSSEEVPF
jgi:single-strand DNA-binding protein